MDNLTASSTIWPQIKTQLEIMNAIGPALQLGCRKHPDNRSSVACANDFNGLPLNGCHVRCETELVCGHTCTMYCHELLDPDHKTVFSCQKPCERMTCEEHKCLKKCGKECGKCSTMVEKVLPCGHTAILMCASDPLTHNCEEKVTVTLEYCGHTQEKLCYKEVNPMCFTPCSTTNSCGHKCQQLCHKHNLCIDSICHIVVQKELLCGHTVLTQCYESIKASMLLKCREPCSKILSCGHPCEKTCGEDCSQCDFMVEKIFPCGHQQLVACSEGPENSFCREPCQLKLPCEHPCAGTCSQPCSATSCEELVRCDVEPKCGHDFIYIPCHLNQKELKEDSDILLQHCMAPCRTQMDCGHMCSGQCGPCVQGCIHVPCAKMCSKTLPCGHSCKELCSAECPALCNQPCLYSCQHGSCSDMCGQPCSPCRKPCERRCMHRKCSRPCSEQCDSLPCELPCPKRRPCGHPCAGFCGELCPQECPICAPITFQYPGYIVKPDHRYVVLEECNHPVEEKLLTKLLTSKSLNVRFPKCPVCAKQVTKSIRFKEIIKQKCLELVSEKDLKREKISRFVKQMKFNIKSLMSPYTNSHIETFGDTALFILGHLRNCNIHYETTLFVYEFFIVLTGTIKGDKQDLRLERRKVLLKALSLRLTSMSTWTYQQFKTEIDYLKSEHFMEDIFQVGKWSDRRPMGSQLSKVKF